MTAAREEFGGGTHAVFGRGDTIAAQGTPAGRSAIALIRMSGPDAHGIGRRHLDPFPGAARVAVVAACRGADGEIVDRCMVTRFDGPQSYTGEDMVEIATHGGLVSPARVLEQLVASGARPAERGEFTLRAVLNGKMDLLQAEAIGDLIDARSRAMQRAAVQHLDRGLSRRIEDLRAAILQVEALLAYDIDFPEEDDGPVPRERISLAAQAAIRQMEQLLTTAPAGELIREGALVVIAGAPNVGKSSLFNAILGRSRAIVTDIPGTTRDAIEAIVEGPRWPMRLVDTAGLRATADLVEQLGVEVSEQHLAAADVVLACGDSEETLKTALVAARRLAPDAAAIAVRTKIDLTTTRPDQASMPGGNEAGAGAGAVAVSAHSGEGLRDLLSHVEEAVAERAHAPDPDAPILTRARHRLALETAREEMTSFVAALERDELPGTVIALHLRAAAAALAELIGTIDVEDVLGRVFADFCVGK